MADEQTKQKEEQSEKEKVVKQTQKEALSPDQKHQNYLDDIERLHNEP